MRMHTMRLGLKTETERDTWRRREMEKKVTVSVDEIRQRKISNPILDKHRPTGFDIFRKIALRSELKNNSPSFYIVKCPFY